MQAALIITIKLLTDLRINYNACSLLSRSCRGDQNKSDIWGNTPLHHASANGHMQIVSFLVNFGANLFALDNDFHTPMDVAASRDHMDCVRFLDTAAAKQTGQNAKRVARLKEQATKDAERRVKQCERVKKKHQNKMDKMYRSGSVSERSSLSGSGTWAVCMENSSPNS